jgi:hypothetical protein
MTATTVAQIYGVFFDVAPDFVDQFEPWFAERHAPDLDRSGIQALRAYRCVEGDHGFVNIYEVPGPEVFDNPVYRQARDDDDRLGHAESKLRGLRKATYQPRPIGPADDDSTPPAWMCALSFSGDLTDAEVDEWTAERFAGSSVARVRVGRLAGLHPLFRDTPAQDLLVLSEWRTRPADASALAAALHEQFDRRVRDVQYAVGRLYLAL